jgi:hypothetical protein
VKLSDTNDYPDTSVENMQAMEIGGRDVLAIGPQDCENDPTPGAGRSSLELYDITDPSNPRFLSLFNTDGSTPLCSTARRRTPSGSSGTARG